MTNKPTLEEWNWYVLMLGQALIGAISTNIRMISLKFMQNSWRIEVILEMDNFDDEQEMNDVCDDLLTYIDDVRDYISDETYKKITSKCEISKERLIVQVAEDCRVVFKRKEPDEATYT